MRRFSFFADLSLHCRRSRTKPSDARKRWETSPHGRCSSASCRRPSTRRASGAAFARRRLPGATACNATTSQPGDAPCRKMALIVDRMVVRMEGRGNMGTLMSEMMAGVMAPTARRKPRPRRVPAKARADATGPKRYPEVNRPSGEAFRARLQPVPRAARPASATARRSGRAWSRGCRKTWSG